MRDERVVLDYYDIFDYDVYGSIVVLYCIKRQTKRRQRVRLDNRNSGVRDNAVI